MVQGRYAVTRTLRRQAAKNLGTALALCFALVSGASARPADDGDSGSWDVDLSLYGWPPT
jgi:hypothetical protein